MPNIRAGIVWFPFARFMASAINSCSTCFRVGTCSENVTVLARPPIKDLSPLLEDAPAWSVASKNVFKESRFYYDEHFPQDLAEKLFETWIERSCYGYADKVFVAIRNNKVVGYITCNLETSGIGSIGLVGVAPRVQGRSIGTNLVYHALSWFTHKKAHAVEAPTQERNYPAKKMYKKCGFIISKREHWYHKWFEPRS